MAGQDFNTVSFGNKKPAQQPQKVAAHGHGAGGSMATSSGMNAAKLDAETDELKHQAVSKDLRMAIMKARTAKGLSQKQLAQQVRAARCPPLASARAPAAPARATHCVRRSAAAQHGAERDQ